MKILVNGREHEVPEGITIAELLAQLQASGRHLAVEVNHQLVPRAKHAEHRLAERDSLEVVSLVGGG